MVTNVLWRNNVTISITLSHPIGSNKKQSKQSMNADNKLLETVVCDCHLLPIGLQTTIQNSVTYNI